jgi:CIC family chloride channel protein
LKSTAIAGVEERDQRLARGVRALLDHWQPPETVVLITTALLIGLGGGLGAVVFRWLIDGFTHISFDLLRDPLAFMGSSYVLVAPALGGLLAGPLIYFFAREAKGHGVPEVMEAVALRGGRIRPVVVVIKSLASSLSIGSGGSVGREGPIVQIGSALGSTIGQLLRLSDERIRNLVACGAAAGIAATFNAPIAGVLFALEIILGEFSVGYFSTVVISSVTASVIGRIAFGNVPAFVVPQYAMVSPWELVLYVLLGGMAGLVAVLFVRVLYWFEDFFDAWHFPEYIKPAVGGLLVGAIGLYFPHVFGVGYKAIEDALLGKMLLSTMGLLILFKILATSLTIGSGGSGGVFAPSLFVGAMFGGTFGWLANQVLPNTTAAPGAYALVGMAAVFAGAAHAPITSIIILFEMTNDYRIILPLMLATVVSTLLSQKLFRESIYTLKLTRRGIRLEHGRDIDVMQGVLVGEAMTTKVDTVDASVSLFELERLFHETHHHGFPVLDSTGDLYGVVTIQDLERAKERGPREGLCVRDIATRRLLVAYPDEPVGVALKRLGTRDVGRLPVVDRQTSKRLLGVIRRHDIVRAYRVGMGRKLEMQARAEMLRLGKLTDTEFVQVAVPPKSPVVYQPIRELNLPEDCVLVSVMRDNKVLIPHGDTRLSPGDRLTALVKLDCAAAFWEVFDQVSLPTNRSNDSRGEA